MGFSTFGMGVTEMFFNFVGKFPDKNDELIIIEIGSIMKSMSNLKHLGGISSGPVALLVIFEIIFLTSSDVIDLKYHSVN